MVTNHAHETGIIAGEQEYHVIYIHIVVMSTLTDLIRDRRGLKAIPNKPIKIGKTKRALDRKKDGAGEADDADDESKVHNDKVREKRRPVP